MTKRVRAPAEKTAVVFGPQVLAIQLALAVTVGVAAGVLHFISPLRADFGSFWAAHHVASAYDTAALSRFLHVTHAYFPYPPTFLMLTMPLAWVSVSVGYVAWCGLSAAAIVASLRRLLAPAVMVFPIVLLSEVNGQTSLIMGACLFAAATLERRPILAGALLGLAACIKPQVVVLAPLVFLAAGQWRVLASAMVTGLVLCLAATLVYGVGAWTDWLASLPGFLQVNDAAWTRRYLSLPGAWKIVALAAGAAAAWWAGRRGRVELGVFIAIAAALLGSLHAMDYDEAIFAPFVLSAALARRWWGLPYAGALLLPASPWSVLALAVLAIVDVFAPPPKVDKVGAEPGAQTVRPSH
ncbi:glycosyltransferase family 87 protein [Phenylobacterium sp.]|uniref:glycosyltransferase family 87 protein n=1 Tax=Phenylobacterium sp. TaxID=1871053 RepID=UPI0035694062